MSARVVPLWIAEEQGILAKHAIDSEQVFIRSAPTLVAGLASGDLSIGTTAGTPDGLCNVQRLMALRSPKVGEVKIETVIDNRIIRRLDESGFIDKAYAAQGIPTKQ